MPFRDILHPDMISKLMRVLDEHCERHGITSEEDRSSAATSLLRFYKHGVEDDNELARLLELQDDRR